ncbi:MAG: 1,6-anhydro-N-acetylmuramyl-L-alanine amidase AmpD [Gammaproteobacteria bacterium]|nr:1,6-anhydro-N-acetylmuramyl-L-alanine amidase AmpD [Gammaproteobacteria bacterium]
MQIFKITNGIIESEQVRYIPSVNFNNRPRGIIIDLLVIHCASLPEGEFDNNNLEQLFSGKVGKNKLIELGLAEDLEVSTHLYIKRNGEILQFVPFDKRAWHAGVSSFNGRAACNDFSIGIELQGTVYTEFTDRQYLSLVKITKLIQEHYPEINKNNIKSHSDIAPGRKQDPGPGFNWDFYLSHL